MDLMIFSISVVSSILYIMTSQISNVWMSIVAYIVFTSFYYMTITISR